MWGDVLDDLDCSDFVATKVDESNFLILCVGANLAHTKCSEKLQSQRLVSHRKHTRPAPTRIPGKDDDSLEERVGAGGAVETLSDFDADLPAVAEHGDAGQDEAEFSSTSY